MYIFKNSLAKYFHHGGNTLRWPLSFSSCVILSRDWWEWGLNIFLRKHLILQNFLNDFMLCKLQQRKVFWISYLRNNEIECLLTGKWFLHSLKPCLLTKIYKGIFDVHARNFTVRCAQKIGPKSIYRAQSNYFPVWSTDDRRWHYDNNTPRFAEG